MSQISRRALLHILAAAIAYAGARSHEARAEIAAPASNFKTIYSDRRLRERFYLFLSELSRRRSRDLDGGSYPYIA